MITLPTVRVAGGGPMSAPLYRVLCELGFPMINDDRSGRAADVALVSADSPTDVPATIERLLAGSAERVVVVAEIPDPASFVAAVKAGADGWVLPSIEPAALARTINCVREGESSFSRLDTVLLVRALRSERENVADLGGLTPRERQIHRALRSGTPVREIAASLTLTEATVRWHASRIAKKLTRSAAVPTTANPAPGAARVSSRPGEPAQHRRASASDSHRTDPHRPDSHRAPASPGVADLGRAELRVVELVADGLNNREVAERLFLSRHTVESHLKRVYAKLQIRSRVELTRLLLEATESQLAS